MTTIDTTRTYMERIYRNPANKLWFATSEATTARATLMPFSADTYRDHHVYVEVFNGDGARIDWHRCRDWEHAIEWLTREFGWGWERARR